MPDLGNNESGRIVYLSGSSASLRRLAEEILNATEHGGDVRIERLVIGEMMRDRHRLIIDNEDMEDRADLPQNALIAYQEDR